MGQSSYVMAEKPTHDLEIVRVMVAELEQYIVDDELYRTITLHLSNGHLSSGDQILKMTGADLLTRLYRLHGERAELTCDEQAEFDRIVAQISATIDGLRTRFHERLVREIKVRLNSLRWFLDDCVSDLQRGHVEFPFEMRNRQRIEEALKELDGRLPAELREDLRQIDKRIRLLASESDFLWDKRLKPLFPAETYWYLYLRPQNRT